MALPTGGIRYFRKFLFDQTFQEMDWSRGMVRDIPRVQIPAGGSYDLFDFFVDRPGMIYKRGGTAYQSTALPNPEVDIIAIVAPNFPGQPSVIAFASDSSNTHAYDVTGASHGSGINVGFAPFENPPLYLDRVILTDGLGVAAPKKAYISVGALAIGTLGGTPPVAKVSCLHAGRLLLANNPTNPNRIWFSNAVDAENTWDTTNAWIDVDEPVMGMASLQGVLIVFSRGNCYRILGDIPPGTTNANMSLQPLGNVGCIDARSVVKMNNEIYFANETGVYSTNGSGFQNLTNKPDSTGISSLWQSTLSGFSPALGAVVCAGTYQNQYLLLSVTHNNGTRSQFLYYLLNKSWVRTSLKTGAYMYATALAPTNDIYMGASEAAAPARAVKLSGMWAPASGNKNDADGTAVTPIYESRVIEDGISLKRYGFSHLTYDMRDAASDTPTLAVAVSTGIEADSSYGAVAESPLAATTLATRKRVSVFKDTQGLSFKFTQGNASSKTEIYVLETEIAPLYNADGQ